MPLELGLVLVAWPALSKVRPSALGWPSLGSAPSRLSNEWFSIITQTRWSNGMAPVAVPAGRLGSGRLSGVRRAAIALALMTALPSLAREHSGPRRAHRRA